MHGRRGALRPEGRARHDPEASRPTSARARSSPPGSGSRSPWRSTAHGDLFATDQEGATWLPNGNPFDELLHIQPGRHYGFPPRHPEHPPGGRSTSRRCSTTPRSTSRPAASTSTSPVDGGPSLRPGVVGRATRSSAGYSRGKLYRTKLVKTRPATWPHGPDRRPWACCPPTPASRRRATSSSRAHSGGPDWGSGPDGKGKLYKVSHRDRDPPPSRCWPGRAALTRPGSPSTGRSTPRTFTILPALRQSSSAPRRPRGIELETMRPGYAVVAAQLAQPRRPGPPGVNLSPDRRSLILQTDPHVETVSYAVTLPGMGRTERPEAGSKKLARPPRSTWRST